MFFLSSSLSHCAASPTLRLQCSGGGVEGRYVHVEDERRTTDYFGLCEIHVYAHQGKEKNTPLSYTNVSSHRIKKSQLQNRVTKDSVIAKMTTHCGEEAIRVAFAERKIPSLWYALATLQKWMAIDAKYCEIKLFRDPLLRDHYEEW